MNFSQPWLKEFPADFTYILTQRQTPDVLSCTVHPEKFEHSEKIWINQELWNFLGLDKRTELNDSFLSAQDLPKDITTYATAYAGHQFGNWAGQLGDGRAIYAGEVTAEDGFGYELQWKGVGATPYSRFADGRAVLRSSIRECLMSEAMFHLDIPTTRCLSLALTGEEVLRDLMYDGHPAYEKGAAVIRVAPSFLRIGHFELLSARKQFDTLKKLARFTLKNYYPEIPDEDHPETYLNLFRAVALANLDMLIGWYRVGFTHGVLNTDNTSALGLTIDYGPYGMLEEFNLNFTPNTTDLPGRRYAFGQQGKIMQWNLVQLANALLPLIGKGSGLEKVLDDFGKEFWRRFDQMMCEKLGWGETQTGDDALIEQMQQIMTDNQLDFTLFFKELETFIRTGAFSVENISYLRPPEINRTQIDFFLKRYQERLEKNPQSKEEKLLVMQNNNPWFILRNYQLFECSQALEQGDRTLFDKLLIALQRPYDKPEAQLIQKRPPQYDERPGCSMLSCSS